MNTRLFGTMTAVTLLIAVALTQPVAASQPIHQVRGQGIVQLSPPDGAIYIVTINAWEDEAGTSQGIVTWLNNVGWQWVIAVDKLIMLSENEARIEGIIVQDNKYPGNEGERTVIYRVKDNGQGAGDPPDRIFGVPIQGGNFIVR